MAQMGNGVSGAGLGLTVWEEQLCSENVPTGVPKRPCKQPPSLNDSGDTCTEGCIKGTALRHVKVWRLLFKAVAGEEKNHLDRKRKRWKK